MVDHGFTLLREERVEELDSLARLYRHEGSGAELLSFCNSDENKVFGVSFRTPPPDSSGVAHILEHSVLCGSRKYPVKEPFVELLKGSLQTFLNAFTYPDKTCYPVASANKSDFRNLTDVYLDAVFFPRLSEEIFHQEGWRLEPDNGGFSFKGVVYNEMKGAFSAPESVLARHCLHALFPNTEYCFESGGDPKCIPCLTYENFRAFHAACYHPANARFFFWGDDPEQERLEQLGAVLSGFSKGYPVPSVPLQAPFTAPARLEVPFAASDGENTGMAVVNWLGPDVMDAELTLAFRMLEHILLGMPGSPLRRALIESGLGTDLAGQGLETELRQLTFDAGLKGIAVTDADKVEALVLATLRDIARDGVSQDMAEAAVNSVEFELRENNSGRFPVGLSVMLRALAPWLHGGDPLAPLRFEEPLKAIKNALADGTAYFETLIVRWLIDNPHRILVVLRPDADLAARQEAAERELLAALTAPMREEEKALVLAQAERLRAWQTEPDDPADLARIPRLGVEDLPLENSPVPTERFEVQYPLTLFHPLPTGGIVYAEAAFDLLAVPEPLLPLLPLFGRALLEMGTLRRDFVDLNMLVARTTGGLDADTLFLTHADSRAPVARLVLSGKCAPDKTPEMFALMAEVLTECNFNQQERFLRMALEEKARLEHSLVPAGHLAVAGRLRASLSGAGMLAECTGGISALGHLRALIGRIEKDWPDVLKDLGALRRSIIHRAGLALNLTATEQQRESLEKCALSLAGQLPEQSVDGPSAWPGKKAAFPEYEALVLPARVNYVGKAVNLFDAGYELHGSAAVILKYLRTGYLWEKVRVQGGAYGCLCSLDQMSGDFVMVSYRDPNIMDTLEVFNRAGRHLSQNPPGAEALNAAIVGAIGELDAYLLPDAKGSLAFSRILRNDTEDARARFREEILGTTPEDMVRFGQALEAFTRSGRVCVLGGQALKRAAAKKGWHTETVL